MDTSKFIDLSRRFDERLNEIISLKGQNTQFFTSQNYTEMIEKVKSSKSKTSNKRPEDYQRLRRFDIMTIGETEKLIVPVKEDNIIRFYVKNNEIFQILHEAHLAVGHGGRNRMEKELSCRFKNITREMIAIYLSLCDSCEKKRNVPKKASVLKPILNKEMCARCQVNLIDMQLQDGQYQFILVYRDHATKFVQLRALKTKTAREVAYALLDIFTIFGAPSILHSDNGTEFANEIIQEACDMWPELKIIYGKPKQSQSQGSDERANQDIENILSTWMGDNNTNKWSEGLRLVQLMINRAYDAGINSTPYEAMFRKKLKVGLKSFSIPHEALRYINSEEDLETLSFSGSTVTEKNQKFTDDQVKSTENDQMESIENHQMESNENNQVESAKNDLVESTENDQVESTVESMEMEKVESDKYTHLFSPIITLDVQCDETTHFNTNEMASSEQGVEKKKENGMVSLQNPTKKTWNTSKSKYPKAKIGDTVSVRVSDGDRTRRNRKILATVIAITPTKLYKLSTKKGVLNELYSRSQFTVCKKRFDSPIGTKISFSENFNIKKKVGDSHQS